MPKNFVAMGHEICPVCLVKHTETVLIDKRLKSFDKQDNCTGISLCQEHQKLYDDGFVVLIGVDEAESSKPLAFDTAKRSGDICHIKIETFEKIMNVPIPENSARLAFCPNIVINTIAAMVKD